MHLSGCESLGYQFRSPITKVKDARIGPGKMTPDAIQSEVMSFADTFTAAVTQKWNEAGSAQPASESEVEGDVEPKDSYRARRSAHERKLADVSAAISIAASPNPIVSVADMTTLVTLERELLEEPRTAELFGADMAAQLVATYREQEDAIWRIGKRAFTQEQQDELHGLIQAWREQHPDQRYVSQIRLEDFAPTREQQIPGGSERGSLLSIVWLDPLSGLDPAKREVRESRLLAQRAFFQLTRMPTILKWQAESFYEGFLHNPEIQDTLAKASKIADAAAEIGKTAGSLPEVLATERKATVDQFFAGVTEQREALVGSLDQGREKFQGTLQELRATVSETDKLAGSLTTAAQAIESVAKQVMPERDGPAPDPNVEPGPNGLDRYRESVESTAVAAERLTVLAEKLERLIDSNRDGNGSVHAVVADARENAEVVVDFTFRRLLLLILAVPLVIVLAVVSTRWLTHRIHRDDWRAAQRARS